MVQVKVMPLDLSSKRCISRDVTWCYCLHYLWPLGTMVQDRWDLTLIYNSTSSPDTESAIKSRIRAVYKELHTVATKVNCN